MKKLSQDFYKRDPAIVAKDLLGKILVRRLNAEILSGKIVETEAYYGEDDPASKAYKGRKTFNELMFMDVGKAFVYMVHGNWLLNIVAHLKGGVGAVLIRSIEPLQRMEIMRRNRNLKHMRDLTSGPGKLTRALAITKDFNEIDVTKESSELAVIEAEGESIQICSSNRIGVKVDLPQKLRFYVEGNKFVSKFS